MLIRLLAAVLTVGAMVAARLEPVSFHAGIARVPVQAETPFEALIWYPTAADEVPWRSGEIAVRAAMDAPIAPGRFAIVLLSHGGGIGGGNPLILGELAASLARSGFVVVEATHGRASLRSRVTQTVRSLDAVIAEKRFRSRLDPARVGMLGFSLGGAVTLEVAGAVPDVAHFDAYCDSHPADAMSCDHNPGAGGRGSPSRIVPAPDGQTPPLKAPALKAIALLDPLAALFSREGLAAVTMPALIVRPDRSELPPGGNAIALISALPRPPRADAVVGGHFVFTNVCTPPHATPVCRDPAGVDRAAVHAEVENKVAAFFRAHL